MTRATVSEPVLEVVQVPDRFESYGPPSDAEILIIDALDDLIDEARGAAADFLFGWGIPDDQEEEFDDRVDDLTDDIKVRAHQIIVAIRERKL